MQSYVQYRKFGKAVEKEFARNKAKAVVASERRTRQSSTTSQCPSTNSSTSLAISSSSSNDTSDSSDSKDIEKGSEDPNENGYDGLEYDLPAGVRIATRAELQREDDMADLRVTSQSAVHSSHFPLDDTHVQADCNNETTTAPAHRTVSRITTRTQRSGPTLGHAFTGIHVRDRTTKEGDKGAIVFVVGYQGPDDPLNPHNWPHTTRVLCTLAIASVGFVVGFASAIDSAALPQAAADFGVSPVVESMATALYLIGFGVGSLFAGPLSETLGRNPVYVVSLGVYMVFIMASALAPKIGAQLAFRFLAGFFGSTPLVCAGGSLSDLWSPVERTFAFPLFANAAFSGPVLGPVIGGFIAQSEVLHNWRWTDWITLIISGLILSLLLLFQPETYPNTLLRWRAKHLRRVTGDPRFRASVEVRSEKFQQRLKKALYRPFVLTLSEPIIVLIALYLTVIYIVLFTFLDGYTYIFQDIHGVSQGISGLCFMGIAVGLFMTSALVPILYRWAKRDLKKVKEQGGDRLPPEFRLWYAMLGGSIAIPVSILWMGWTSYPSISIWSPLIASVFFGYGILCVFITSYQVSRYSSHRRKLSLICSIKYIIDSYEVYSASALVSVSLIRYVVAGGMTIVGIPLYENLGVHWTLTILGAISALMAPLPYVFYKHGKWIRSKSKYAINAD